MEIIILLISVWKNILKLFVDKKPPEEIRVKAKLKASKVLKLISFKIIKVNIVSEV